MARNWNSDRFVNWVLHRITLPRLYTVRCILIQGPTDCGQFYLLTTSRRGSGRFRGSYYAASRIQISENVPSRHFVNKGKKRMGQSVSTSALLPYASIVLTDLPLRVARYSPTKSYEAASVAPAGECLVQAATEIGE